MSFCLWQGFLCQLERKTNHFARSLHTYFVKFTYFIRTFLCFMFKKSLVSAYKMKLFKDFFLKKAFLGSHPKLRGTKVKIFYEAYYQRSWLKFWSQSPFFCQNSSHALKTPNWESNPMNISLWPWLWIFGNNIINMNLPFHSPQYGPIFPCILKTPLALLSIHDVAIIMCFT